MDFRHFVENFVLRLGAEPDNGAAAAAVAEVKSLGQGNPMNPKEVVIGEVVVEVEAWKGHLFIKSIRSMTQRRGFGSEVMATICRIADRHGVTTELVPAPFGSKAMTERKLISYYERFGFIGGPNKMLRPPTGG